MLYIETLHTEMLYIEMLRIQIFGEAHEHQQHLARNLLKPHR
jgi:hypothetical protein